jgi:alpha-tubulin suppressor-like RCC1 family protein
MKAFKNMDIADFKISHGGLGVILTRQGFVYSWGQNEVGQLGLGDFKPRDTPLKLRSLNEKKVTAVAVG